jgi:hypothetical protein
MRATEDLVGAAHVAEANSALLVMKREVSVSSPSGFGPPARLRLRWYDRAFSAAHDAAYDATSTRVGRVLEKSLRESEDVTLESAAAWQAIRANEPK